MLEAYVEVACHAVEKARGEGSCHLAECAAKIVAAWRPKCENEERGLNARTVGVANTPDRGIVGEFGESGELGDFPLNRGT